MIQPTYVITQARANPDFPRDVIFRCPCGRRHEHGWHRSDTPGRPSHRVAHCATELHPRGYYFVVPAGVPLPPAPAPSRFAQRMAEQATRRQRPRRRQEFLLARGPRYSQATPVFLGST